MVMVRVILPNWNQLFDWFNLFCDACPRLHIIRYDVEKVNRLESIGDNYMDKHPGMFSSKTFISFRLKKVSHGPLG